MYKPLYEILDKIENKGYQLVIVGVKVQDSCVLGLELARVQVGKYWILVFIREPEIPRRYE